MIKKTVMGALICAVVISCLCLFGCTVKRRGESGVDEESSYEIHYYFENGDGVFVKNADLDVSGTEKVGKTVSVLNPAEYPDYVPDVKNTAYRPLDVVTAESVAHVEIYYARKSYNVTVSGGTASAPSAKWGERVTLTPYGSTSDWTIVKGADTGAKISGNILTMGKGDVEVSVPSERDLKIYSDKYVSARNSRVTATLDVTDATVRQGVVALYNDAETQNVTGATETYYLFASEGNKVALYLFDGEDQVEIKSAPATVSAGKHSYGICIDGNGNIDCYFDGGKAMTVTAADFGSFSAIEFAGRTGSYSADFADNEKNREVTQGDMSLSQVKEYLIGIGARVSADYYVYDNDTHQISNTVGEVAFGGIYGFERETTAFVSRINACEDISSIVSVLKGSDDVKLSALKTFTKNSLADVAKRVYDTILDGKIDTASVGVVGTSVTLAYDFYAGDTRWWVPNAYMLYSTWPAPDNVGIIEKLVAETDAAQTFDEVYGLCDKYICDILCAAAYRGMEYYYWQEYARDSEAVDSEWWHLYTYFGSEGENFVYCGKTFGEYSWTKDYRLNAVLFNPSSGEFVNTPQDIINAYSWVVEHQTLKEGE